MPGIGVKHQRYPGMRQARMRSLATGTGWSPAPSATSVGTEILAISRPAASMPFHQSAMASPSPPFGPAGAAAPAGYSRIAALKPAKALPD
jgi:hypothetical protein